MNRLFMVITVIFFSLNTAIKPFSVSASTAGQILSCQSPYTFKKQASFEKFSLYMKERGARVTSAPLTQPNPFTNTLMNVGISAIAENSDNSSAIITPQDIETIAPIELFSLITPHSQLTPWGLKHLLFHPLHDYEQLLKRQRAITKISQEEALQKKIMTLVPEESLNQLFTYWNNSLLHQQAQALYFSQFLNTTILKNLHLRNKTLNHNITALNIANNSALAIAMAQLCTEFLSAGVTGELMSASIHMRKPHIGIDEIVQGITHPIRLHSPYKSVFQDTTEEQNIYPLLEAIKLSGGDWFHYFQKNCAFLPNPFLQNSCAALVTGAYIAFCDYQYMKRITQKMAEVDSLYTTCNQLQASLVSIARIIQDAHAILDIIEQEPALQHCPGAQELNQILIEKTKNSPKLNHLIELLQAPTFQTITTRYSKGTVLHTHKLLASIKHELIPLLQALSLIKASVDIAQTISSSVQENPWTFPTLTPDNNAHIDLIDMWHPLIGDQPAYNSLTFGSGFPHHAIISGPNGGGKSTTMQAVALSLLLAQSWTIIPAKAGTLSVFAGIKIYNAPQADITRGTSTFMAEKMRFDAISQELDSIAPDKCYFIMLDEPLRGTIEREAAQRIYEFGAQHAGKTNCCVLLATHIEKPTELAAACSNFANYHMELIETDHGFTRSFKIVPGAATWWFHDDAKRKKFIDSMNFN